MNAVAAPAQAAPNTAARAAWVCLGIAWLTFVLPIPGIGLFIGWPLNLVAFILAIVAMAKRGAMAGLFQLLASLIASPIVYFIGLAILAGTVQGMAAVQEAQPGNASTATAAQVEQQAPAITVDARKLFAAYDANEIAADAEYKGKALQVSGKVDSINSDMGDEPVVLLAAGDFRSVHVGGLSKDIAASLQKGQQITVTCTGAGEVIGSPMLEDCALN